MQPITLRYELSIRIRLYFHQSIKTLTNIYFYCFIRIMMIMLSAASFCSGCKNVFCYRMFQTVRRDLMHAIRKKRPAMAENIENIIYHHDNAPAHTASESELELSLLGFQRLPHPPYSPDLAPLDFAYFPSLKSHLRGTRFNSLADIRLEVNGFNNSLGQCWFQSVFDKWVRRHEKCVEHQGRYFEKE